MRLLHAAALSICLLNGAALAQPAQQQNQQQKHQQQQQQQKQQRKQQAIEQLKQKLQQGAELYERLKRHVDFKEREISGLRETLERKSSIIQLLEQKLAGLDGESP